MSDQDESGRGLWRWPKSRWLLGIPLGGFLMIGVGAIGLGVFNWTLKSTSTTEFCFGCHSHEVNLRAAYEASSHFSNRTGVRAECSDCHLPKDDWLTYVWMKVEVLPDLFVEMSGALDTPEKWQARLPHMAEVTWEQFRANDSRFCRNCHTREAMNLAAQSQMAAGVHNNPAAGGKTCIDCHAGLVHALPQAAAQRNRDVEDLLARNRAAAAGGGE